MENSVAPADKSPQRSSTVGEGIEPELLAFVNPKEGARAP
jgi:hypothetical protein